MRRSARSLSSLPLGPDVRLAVCLGACLSWAACSKTAAPASAPAADRAANVATGSSPVSATAQAAPPAAAVAPAAVPAPAHIDLHEPPKPPPSLLSSYRPPASDPQEVAAVKLRLLGGEASTKILKDLQRLSSKHASNAELPYLMGQVYFGRLWVGDGLKAFRKAISIEPALRENPFLIRAAVTGLANDSDHRQVARFLSQDIGPAAAPYLEEVLYGEWRGQVKERADSILRSLK